MIVTLGEAREAVGPFLAVGLMLVERLTVPVNPLIGVIVRVEVALLPRLTVRLVGLPLMVKPLTVKVTVAVWVRELLVPVTVAV